MKKILSSLTIIILSSCVINATTLAQTSFSPTPTNTEQQQGIRDKVKELVDKKVNNIVTEDQKKGWAGTITSINKSSLEISQGEQNRTVVLNEEIKIINQNREETTFESLEEEQYVLAMGYEKTDGTLNARRLVVTNAYQPREKTSVHGKIVNKANDEEIILIQNSEQEYELIFDSKTVINEKIDSEIEDIKYTDLALEQEIIAIIEPADGETNSYNAIKILVTTIKESSPAPTESE